MSSFKSYQFNQSQVSAMATDGMYIWLAFSTTVGECVLKKVSGRDLSQVYFSVSLPVESITNLFVLGDYIYATIVAETYVLYRLSTSSPFTSQNAYTKSELSISEYFISGVTDGTNLYLLTPGIESGINAKVVVIDDSGYLLETVDLNGDEIIEDANSIAVDNNDNLWITTSGALTNIYRVFYESAQWKIVNPNIV
jgi:hypothetical protein